MSDQLDLDLDLDRHLSRAATALDVPSGSLDAVVRRGRQRDRRRRTALTVTTTVAVVAGAVTSFGLLDRGEGGTPVAAGAGAQRGKSGIRWEVVGSESSLGFPRSLDGDGPVYALSTAPGDTDPGSRNQSRVLWRSDDGVDWKSVSKLDDDLFLSDLASSGGRIYAVGTAPATAAVPGQRATSDLVAGWSDDGGKTWRKAVLPLDLRTIAASTTSSGVSFTQVAAGARGTVAVAVPYARLDVTRLLPPGVTASNGWAVTATGVDLLGEPSSTPCPPGTTVEPPAEGAKPLIRRRPVPVGEVHSTYCYRGEGDPVEVTPQQAQGVASSYTWDQLGVEGDLLRAVRTQPIAFAAGPGSTTFERVELPEVEAVRAPLTVQAGDHGFDLVVARGGTIGPRPNVDPPRLAVLHSANGKDWSTVDFSVSGAGWVAAAGSLGDRTALVAAGEAGDPVVVRSDGAGGWSSLPLGDVVSRPPGTRLGVVSAGVGPFGVVAVVAVVPAEPVAEEGVGHKQEFRLLVSRDGTVWDDHRLDDLAGGRVSGIGNLVLTRDQAVVTAILGGDDPAPGQRSKRVTLAGRLG